MINAILAVIEQSRVGKEAVKPLRQERTVMQTDGVTGYVTQPYAANR